jgi:hypothetical protein
MTTKISGDTVSRIDKTPDKNHLLIAQSNKTVRALNSEIHTRMGAVFSQGPSTSLLPAMLQVVAQACSQRLIACFGEM